MELIDRRKLVSDFWKGVEDCAILSFEDTDELMENAPTVDAVEVVHGRWEHRIPDHEVPWYWVNECSNCGFRGEIWYNYCPNCGAKMEKGE